MTDLRLIPLPLHAVLRLATGLLTMAVPFLAGFEVSATLMSIIVGSIVVGVALTATPDERGRTLLSAETLHAMDWATVIALLGTAAVVALDGDAAAGIVLTAIGAVQLAGNLTTRYSVRG